jgi:hypothetical protein
MDPATFADLDPVGFKTFDQFVSGSGIIVPDPKYIIPEVNYSGSTTLDPAPDDN